MSAKNRNKKTEIVETNFLDKIDTKKGFLITGAILCVILFFVFKPFIFQGLNPGGEDVVGSIGKTNFITKYQNETGETALWNPSIFSGMPAYPRLTHKILNIDLVLGLLSSIFYWGFWYFLAGGLGIYLFMIQKNIPWYIALIMAIVFILLPDWMAQLGAGHNAKIRALMVFPSLLAAFNYFFEKKNWMSTGLFALIFTWMVRTQHFQIIFYAILLMFFLYIVPFVKLWIDNKQKDASGLLIKFVIAIILTIVTSSSPFLTIKEYTPYSTRGGNAVVMNENEDASTKSGGVSFDYATQWSLAPSEMLDFFVARFHGGYSQEIYEGKKYPQLKGRAIPGYWGEKPFNGNFSFIGILIICFAILGFIQNRKNVFIIATLAFVIFTLLLSFGRHFPMLYELFFYNFPYFSKFRAPSMITNASFIGMLILAAYGIKSLIEGIKESEMKNVYFVFGGAIVLSISLLIFKNSFDFTTARELKQYDANTLKMLKDIRLEFLSKDLVRMFIILLLGTGFIFGFIKKKIKTEFFVIIITLLIGIEVYVVTDYSMSRISMHNKEELKAKLFHSTQVTNYLEKEPKDSRAIALNNHFQSNHYAYFYPTINGYSPIKLQLIQDVIEHNLMKANTSEKINWNVINMLNGKYVIAGNAMPHEFLRLVSVDKGKKELLYENLNVLPKAWFVKNIKSFETDRELVNYMNDTTFTPVSEALINIKNSQLKTEYSDGGTIELMSANPNSIELKVENKNDGFLVLSEVYYPEGWKAIIDGNETPIYRINHLLRGIEVPSGAKGIKFEFVPDTYVLSKSLVWVGNISVLLIIFVPFVMERIRKKQK